MCEFFCKTCGQSNKVVSFRPQRKICRKCNARANYTKIRNNPEKLNRMKETLRKSAKKNYHKRVEYKKEWSIKNKESILIKKKIWLEKKIKDDPLYLKRNKRKPNEATKFTNRIRASFLRLIKNRKSFTALTFSGCSSIEDFIFRLTQKTDNPNWIRDKYEIDHIWQVHWFSDFCLKNLQDEDKIKEVCMLIHHIDNLRPLKRELNIGRSHSDFSILDKNDLPKYEAYLNEDKLISIKKFFNL